MRASNTTSSASAVASAAAPASPRRLTTRLGLPLLAAAAVGLLGPPAEAKPDRQGIQTEFMIGASACVSGRAQCTAEDEAITGRTNPHVGLGMTVGFRPIRFLMVGAAYNLGFFNPDYALAGDDVYRRAYQNSFFGVVRAILPIWRFDLGLELGPGWSRQTFRGTSDSPLFERVSSQGFAMKIAPVIDVFLTRHLFLGAKVDFIVNAHGEVCTDGLDQQRVCTRTQDTDQAAVHQLIAGFHIGSVF
ncbi:MAG: hypothetical protein R3A79_09080 [Nannocystaceae bacterium]